MTQAEGQGAPASAGAVAIVPPPHKPQKKPINATIGDIVCPMCMAVADVRRASTGGRKYYWYCRCGMITPNLATGQDYILENARVWGDGDKPEGAPSRLWGRVVDVAKIRNGSGQAPRIIEGAAPRIPDPEKPGKLPEKPEPPTLKKPESKPVTKNPEPQPVKEGFGFFS